VDGLVLVIIEEVATGDLLPEVEFELFAKLEAILEAAVIMGNFDISLVLFRRGLPLCHEQESSTETYASEVSYRLAVLS
jgi:hypothetical protein